jgi:transcription initiation factor TFIID subunit 13
LQTKRGLKVATKRNRLSTEDVVFLYRKDKKKYSRAKELLALDAEIKRARKAFQDETAPGSS